MDPGPEGLPAGLAVPVTGEQRQSVIEGRRPRVLDAALPQGLQAAKSFAEGPAQERLIL